VSESFLQQLLEAIHADPETSITVSVEDQTISIDAIGATENFDINPYKKTCLLNGYDDIDYLLSIGDEIKAFEQSH
jgi:3-isopropylmalate/(R)-2-methylmalate dehydratase small subunit